MRNKNKQSRRGTALVLVVVCLIPLVACVALAVDLGLLAAARTQIQGAADSAAMAGARTLNGATANGANNNYSNVVPNAQAAVTANKVLGTAITTSQLTTQIGRYTYDSNDQRFEGLFPGPTSENWSLVQATVSCNVNSSLAFSKIFNFTVPNIQATASAAHRPRDICIILDYSGSMRFASLLSTPYYGSRTTNNKDSVVPAFGGYSSSSASLVASTSYAPYDDANITAASDDGRGAICADFFTDTNGTSAFTAASAGYASTPGGDNYLKDTKNTASNYGQTLWTILSNSGTASNSNRDATFESSGYKAYAMHPSFSRYTQGPGYWGKTFFIWPPDPSNGADGLTNDWRKRYFDYPGTSTQMDDNSKFWDSSGSWMAPGSSTYQIDYTAILDFIKNIGPNPFPSRLQSGRILYYDQIPSTIDTSSWPPSDLNQRFWKDYIDYVLGLIQTGSSSWIEVGDQTGYGDDFTWGTIKITAKSSLSGSPKPYMQYSDNPKRPRTRFWFGPMTMIDFLGNYNLWYQVSPYMSRYCWWPGTCHESPMYGCKLGIRAALSDINNNHPNDLVSLTFFSTPKDSSSDQDGRFNRVRVGLGRDYDSMQESLWYPPATLGSSSSTVRPYDSNNIEVPRAMGGTCYAYPLMLAYNQFSANNALKAYNSNKAVGDAGGNGRRGAQRVIIFETDGAPNTTASAGFVNGGACNSYYSIRYNSTGSGSGEYPTGVYGYGDNNSTVTSQIYDVCNQICALETAGNPGYSTTSKKVLIHCIGFGPVFDPSSSGAAAAKNTLNQMQQIGSVTDGMPSYKIVYGTETQVINNLQQAFTKILQDGVQVSLIQ